MLNINTDIRQLAIFLLFVAVGVVLGAIFHTVDYPLSRFCRWAWLRQTTEGVVGLGELLLSWLVNAVFNDGQFRLYIVVALFVGLALYYFICKSTLDNMFKALYNLLNNKKVGDDNAQNIHK